MKEKDGEDVGREDVTDRHFYTQTLLRRDALKAETLLNTDSFTRRRFFTHAFTHVRFYMQAPLRFTRKISLPTNAFTHNLHRDTFTHIRLYTQMHLHRDAFTHKRFATQAFSRIDVFLRADAFTHTDAFTHRRIYTHTRTHTHTDV